MKVVVRVRPHNQQESNGAYTTCVQPLDSKMLVFDPKDEDDQVLRKTPGCRKRILKRKSKDLRMMFDRVFDENATQMEVHESSTKLILDAVLDGYNCSIFAYGATGAGKTFTMLGDANSPGIIFLCMMELYQRIEELKKDKAFEVAVSYIEVYNESIQDLLVPSSKHLAVREDPQKGVVVSGLSLHQPKSAEELMKMLEFGNSNRTQHPTDANATSSRSHAVFQVYVKQSDRTTGMSSNFKRAKLSLIDLAGSERATVTSNKGARMREGANINKSLLALGNCINALAEICSNNSSKSRHIPYRDSKLTRLLKDSLGGNCQTVMIAAVSPSSMSYEDTYNTLKYADRAKSIKSKLKANVVKISEHISKYPKIIAELRKEVKLFSINSKNGFLITNIKL
ncbi:uncharacterized protein TRIADDRAFT_18179 [Trichoplax adhaerens]|uniref:Kinesin-like protein n=1 Tax=Trichoplax adhaerens TaxID=10228 RepID=B3RKD8_TRIAD|nr:hypothetical protein TRIADDRAFT_18179 [Trichoplax adhaerens]EDV29388.1 hypothetical protein TRIADDRAFT_18179 [Trichoplax adhaerens]|eukprot:XP_002108590.1 hypothetical protein TRIADDRAFT_18179 [Trichoplax adhaerens]